MKLAVIIAAFMGVYLATCNCPASQPASNAPPGDKTAEVVTEGEFAHALIEAMGLSRTLPASPSDQACFDLLTQRGVTPKAGWNSTSVVTRGTLSRVVVQALGQQKEIKQPEDDVSWIAYLKAVDIDVGRVSIALDNVAKRTPKVDPRADQVIRRFSEHLAGLKSFRTEIDWLMNTEMEGMKQELSSSLAVAVQRPDRFAVVLVRGMGTTVVCDGSNVFTYVSNKGKYTQQEADGTAPAALDGIAMGGLFPLVEILLSPDPAKSLLRRAKSASYVGEEKLDAVPCHRLRLELPDPTGRAVCAWDLWVESGGPPLLRRVAADLSKSLMSQSVGEDMFGTTNVHSGMTYTLDNWKAGVKLPVDQFVFAPPPGSKKVDSLYEGRHPARREPHAMVGQPAPPLKLDLLSGGQFDLAEHRGKDVVVLDFWATWCAPCRKALPLYAQATADYKDRGVVFVAVNQREDKAKIRDYLMAEGLDVAVGLDTNAAIGGAYHVEGIPHSVVIGRDGVIQSVHVGYSPAVKSQLKKELDVLLAGESLLRQNLVRNPGFEVQGAAANNAQYWTRGAPDTHGDLWGSALRADWRCHSGAWEGALRGLWANAGNEGGFWQEATAVPGAKYRASGWFWADRTWSPRVQRLKLEFLKDGETIGQTFLQKVETSLDRIGEEWSEVMVERTAPANARWVRIAVEALDVSNEGALQFDDLKLERVE